MSQRNPAEFLLVDISNTFTKISRAQRERLLGKILRIPTPELGPHHIRESLGSAQWAVVSSVVPQASERIRNALPPGSFFVGPRRAAGLKIRYPHPETIGADRLANAVACARLFGAPAIVVDFGTAVTFDVISEDGAYVGGVIAPGLGAMTEGLHARTALLPRISLRVPKRVVGKSTREAMLSGAVHGYRGLVMEILHKIVAEQFGGSWPRVVATGGDAKLVGESLGVFQAIEPRLTLEGLRFIAAELPPLSSQPASRRATNSR